MPDNTSMIDIKQEFILPLPFRVFGFIMALAGLIALAVNAYQLIAFNTFSWWLPGSILVAAGGGIIATAHYRLRINAHENWFKIYVWILGFHQGKRESFDHIENIFINRVVESTRMSSYTGHPSVQKEYLFKAFMKLDTGEKIHLDTDNEEHKLNSRIDIYIRQLGDAYRGQPV